MNAQVQKKFVKSVSEKKETIQLWSCAMKTSEEEDTRVNETSVPVPQTSQVLDSQQSQDS